MQLILPDVLEAARGLSPGASFLLLVLGLSLWAAGWRWHRFWVVFGITLGAGLVGLTVGQTAGMQVMVVGVLVAVSAGMLALEVARVLSFVTGGAAAWILVQTVLPQVQELWAVFLSGGLLGLVLYQLWTMLTTSLLGVLLTWHAGFVLAEEFLKFDVAKWVGDHTAALNGGAIAVAVLGVVVQSRTAPKVAAEGSAKEEASADEAPAEEPGGVRVSWWRRVLPGRKAA
jgi:hypothetical protein